MRRWPWVMALMALAACGGADAPAEPPPQYPPPPVPPPKSVRYFATPEDADAAIDAAERDLQQILLAGDQPQPGIAPTPSPSPLPYPQSQPPDDDDSSPQVLEYRQDRCSRACAALASMDRAAERLCELTGDEDTRCLSARERVRAARALVERTCTRCSG